MEAAQPFRPLTPTALIGPNELARWLSVNVFVIYHWAAAKKIPCYRIGDGPRPRIRFNPLEVERWLQEHKTEASDISVRLRRRLP